ncbi:MAG: ABC transporter substrate-binding protein [Desulfarculus sp.]|nr:ABC transporter substrate-binding protein [Desulfarculus sp.]
MPRMSVLACWGLAALMALLAACGPAPPLRLGFLGGLSGRVADLGVAGRNGAMLAVEQKNASGGLGGRLVELIVRDDGQEAEQARRALTELLDLGVEAVIGPMTSSVAMDTLPLLRAGPVVMVSPTVTTTLLTGRDDNFLRVISTTYQYASKSARHHRQKLGRARAAAIYDVGNAAYSESWLHDFRQTFEELGGHVVLTRAFRSSNEAAFLETVTELLAARPDLVVIISNAVDAALICQQVRKLDEGVAIAMSEWASTERFVELAGAAADGVVVTQFLDRNDTSRRYLDFVAAYRARFGQEPGFAGLAGHDAAQVVMRGLESRRPGQTLKQAIIAQGTFQGVQQAITMDQHGDADRGTFMTMVKDGRYLTLE